MYFLENEGLCPCPPPEPFLKEGFGTPKNFQSKYPFSLFNPFPINKYLF